MKLLISSAFAALVAGLTPLAAQTAPPPPPGVAQGTEPMPMAMHHVPPVVHSPVRVMQMRDRVVTREEVVRHVRAMFERLDTNHDGFITKNEVAALDQRMMKGRMSMNSRMHQGGMDMGSGMSMGRGMGMGGMGGMGMGHNSMTMPGEPMARMDPGAMFDRIDTNHDGVISRQEFIAAHRWHGRRMVMNRSRREMPAGGFAAHLFAMADTNHDGRVSLEEAERAALAHFDRIDLNHDGRITPEERREAHQRMRSEGDLR